MLRAPHCPDFIVPDGSLLYHPARDARFPYLYQVDKHPLVKDSPAVKRILVYVQDTTDEGLKRMFDFEEKLYVPLGPDCTMDDLGVYKFKPPYLILYSNEIVGLFDLSDGTVIFARARGSVSTEDDVIWVWNFLGYVLIF